MEYSVVLIVLTKFQDFIYSVTEYVNSITKMKKNKQNRNKLFDAIVTMEDALRMQIIDVRV